MKIYTKKGDRGDTSLFGGDIASKADLRIEAYGTVDELNSFLGSVLTQEISTESRDVLVAVQHDLFVIGADLATPDPEKARIAVCSDASVDKMEKAIDRMEQFLPPLKQFILPGGGTAGASLHLARTVCRRAERRVVALGKESIIHAINITYLNRLSDLLFVMARYENHLANETEIPWIKPSDG